MTSSFAEERSLAQIATVAKPQIGFFKLKQTINLVGSQASAASIKISFVLRRGDDEELLFTQNNAIEQRQLVCCLKADSVKVKP